MNDYAKILHSLAIYDKSQLEQLFIDLVAVAGIEQIENIANQADKFIDNYIDPDEHYQQSEQQEWKEIDDAMRFREWKSDQNTIY